MFENLFVEPLRGIVPPMVTPLREVDELDHEALAPLIQHLIDGGVSGIFLLGTTGEGPALSHRLRCELIEAACEVVRCRLPVLVGVSDPSLEEAVQMAQRAADSGAQAVVAAPPFYHPLNQLQVQRFFFALADRSPLPVMLYNMPSCTKIDLSFETVRRCTQHENIVGLKDSCGKLENFEQMLHAAEPRADWTMMIGPERLLAAAVRLGGHGGVSGGANLHPRLLVDIYEAAARGDEAMVQRLDEELTRLDCIYDASREQRSVTLGLKCGLAQLGLCREVVSEPLGPCTEEHRQRVRETISDLNLARPSAVDTQGEHD
ncbi:MAG: dihydrodipicolinate synthase family protein [Planctomycetales bacterium]|nr:dihydrodipicolinate synthase family protein [Planctomycetales bacterium]